MRYLFPSFNIIVLFLVGMFAIGSIHASSEGSAYLNDSDSIGSCCLLRETKRGTNGVPLINGSFLQSWLVGDWDDVRWEQELTMMKQLGMDYLVFGPAFFTDEKGNSSALYPTRMTDNRANGELMEACLRNAQKTGIKVFIGLNFNERWWKVDYDADWLYAQMAQGNTAAQELTALFKTEYPDAMYGWYWYWEVENTVCASPERQTILANALNINLDYLSLITPDMPLMLSPFMNYALGTAEACGEMWKGIFAQTHFRSGDIFAPQDCCGAGGLKPDLLPEWFCQLRQAVSTKPGLKFWANVETFDQRDWSTAPMSRVALQLKNVDPYVSNIICFSYNHYNSPYQVDPTYHQAYLEYAGFSNYSPSK